MASIRTPLCDLLKIDTPIVQAPTGPATTPTMMAAVSNTGGLGMLAFLVGMPTMSIGYSARPTI